MAYVNSTSAPSRSFAAIAKGFLNTLDARYTAYRAYRTTFNELQALSNRDLADLGIMRCDIHTRATEAAEAAVK